MIRFFRRQFRNFELHGPALVLVERIAKEQGIAPLEVMRNAMAEYAERHDRQKPTAIKICEAGES